jgi:adenine-specific DNA-methyltransferase
MNYPGQPVSNPWTDITVINPMSKERLDFDGQKPEVLIQRVLMLTTQRGDWVLDSFAGSGTTGAAAHKMGRRWIMVELGEHCHTHIIPRLKRSLMATMRAGSQICRLERRRGIRYFRLASSLLGKRQLG